MIMMMMTNHLSGYSYNEEKENDGVEKESGTKDQNPPFILVMVTKETNALCYDMKIIRVAVIFVSIFLVKYIKCIYCTFKRAMRQVLLSKLFLF